MANFRPLVNAKNSSVELGRSIAFSTMFEYMDLDGDPMRRFRVFDGDNNGRSGFFTYRGRKLDANQTHEFAASQLQFVRYFAGLIVGQELFRVQAFDGEEWSNAESATISTITDQNEAPEVSFVSTFEPVSGEIYRADGLISGSDPDGDEITKFRIRYSNETGAFLRYRGNKVNSGSWLEINADELRFLSVDTKSFAGTKRNFKVFGRAYDGRDWGATETIVYKVAPNNNRPDVFTVDRNLSVGAEILGTTLFTYNDKDGNSGKSVRFYDTGVRAEGGHFTVAGVKQAARQWFTVDYDDLHTVKYHSANLNDTERYRVQVYDGRRWSRVENGILKTIDVPRVSVDMNVILEDLEDVALTDFFQQLDNGPRIRKFRVYDSNDHNQSAHMLDEFGNRLDPKKVHEFTAAEFRNITIRGGTSEDRRHDEIMVRSYNGQEWSTWHRLNVYSEPNYLDAFDLGPSWTANRGQGRELTYTFLQEVPPYYAPDADEHDDFYPYDRHPVFSDFFTYPQRIGARRGLQRWADVSGLTFRETTQEDELGHITFGLTGMDAGVAAYAYLPSSIGPNVQGDIWLNEAYAPNYVQDIGSEGFLIHLHEMGHAFGLLHPFDDGAGDIRPFLPKTTDSEQFTVMSYTQHHGGLPVRASTPMLYDIAGIQELYGQNTNFNGDRTVYRWDRNVNTLETIWDGGGRDTINLRNQVLPQLIDLRQGQFMNVGVNQENVVIAFNSVIEHANGGSHDDVINGNEVANTLYGYDGNDTIRGYGGNDLLRGGAGNDTYVYTMGDGIDRIREGGEGGRDVLEIRVQQGMFNTFPTDPLENSIKVRKEGTDLHLSLVMDGFRGRGGIRLEDQDKGGSRVETLRMFYADEQIEVDVDIASLYAGSTSSFQHFKVTDFQTSFGYIATPV